MNISSANMQSAALLDFAEALGSAANALRRDDFFGPCIVGRRGQISASPEGYEAVTRSPRAWASLKGLGIRRDHS